MWPMIAVLKPSELKSNTGGVLDKAIHSPQYVSRNGILLVITKAELSPPEDPTLSPWEQRAQVIESFYDANKAW